MKRETPEQRRARRLREIARDPIAFRQKERARKLARIRREFGGSHSEKRRHERASECARAGREFNPRGRKLSRPTRRQIRRIIGLLKARHRRLQSTPRISDEERKARAAEYERKRYHSNPQAALYQRIKRNVHKHLRDGKSSKKWAAYLGWTMEELRAHLEKQFGRRMGWHNMGKWHIDHIVAASEFKFDSPAHPGFRACYALSNLRPIWRLDNLRKSARREFLL